MTTSLASTVRQRSGPVAQFKRAGQAAVMLLLWLAASGVHAQSAQPSAVADGMLQAVNPPGKVKTGLTPTAKQHEAQLSAIRQAILQATMDRPTRVLSSAWIDDKGALHESAHFQSEAQVRGVRVLSYVTDEKDAAPQVSAEVLPWGWRTAQTKATTCTAPPRPWRLPLVLQTRADSGFGGTQQFASQAVLNTVSQAWTQHMQSSQRWRALHKETPPESAYLRALTGPSLSLIHI
jgi:hypothetical protein